MRNRQIRGPSWPARARNPAPRASFGRIRERFCSWPIGATRGYGQDEVDDWPWLQQELERRLARAVDAMTRNASYAEVCLDDLFKFAWGHRVPSEYWLGAPLAPHAGL